MIFDNDVGNSEWKLLPSTDATLYATLYATLRQTEVLEHEVPSYLFNLSPWSAMRFTDATTRKLYQ